MTKAFVTLTHMRHRVYYHRRDNKAETDLKRLTTSIHTFEKLIRCERFHVNSWKSEKVR